MKKIILRVIITVTLVAALIIAAVLIRQSQTSSISIPPSTNDNAAQNETVPNNSKSAYPVIESIESISAENSVTLNINIFIPNLSAYPGIAEFRNDLIVYFNDSECSYEDVTVLDDQHYQIPLTFSDDRRGPAFSSFYVVYKGAVSNTQTVSMG